MLLSVVGKEFLQGVKWTGVEKPFEGNMNTFQIIHFKHFVFAGR